MALVSATSTLPQNDVGNYKSAYILHQYKPALCQPLMPFKGTLIQSVWQLLRPLCHLARGNPEFPHSPHLRSVVVHWGKSTRAYAHLFVSVHVCTYTGMRICIYAYMYMFMRTDMYMYVYMFIYICVCIYTYACTCAHIQIHKRVYLHVHVCLDTYTCTHAYTHAWLHLYLHSYLHVYLHMYYSFVFV